MTQQRVISDHYFELRIDGLEPARYRSLQSAMADAASRHAASASIWTVGTVGAEPVVTIRYTTKGTEVACC
jgi:hypothetical protein